MDAKKMVKGATKAATKAAGKVASDAGHAIKKLQKGDLVNINAEDALRAVIKLPVAKVDRSKYLHKELIRYYPKRTVEKAIAHNPAYAGIERDRINKIARNMINYETNKVSAISFAAGVPGGFAMAATVPADVMQYFTFMIRVMQKLAYLYGFEAFELNEDEISDETMNMMLVFLGVMCGVQGANAAVKVVADLAAKKTAKSLAQKALTKGMVYPIVKKMARAVGAHMTKQVFADGVSKIVPVVGGLAAGGLTYATFKPCAKKLRDSLKHLNISDPEFYKKEYAAKWEETDIIDIEDT